MIAEIITPYTGSGSSVSDAIRPLLVDVIGPTGYDDITGNPLANGIHAVNLLVITADVSGAQLSQIKSDDRFFVLEPGPGYNGSALVNWLTGKGARGHGVTAGEDASSARGKVIAYCKELA
jgi:hypothetical protein